MGAKIATLYLVSIASSLIAADQVVPVTLSDGNAKSAIMSQQVINRSLKRDRLPNRKLTPKTDERFKAPTMPDKKTGSIANLRSTYLVVAMPSKSGHCDKSAGLILKAVFDHGDDRI
jgi:hypothetical protein